MVCYEFRMSIKGTDFVGEVPSSLHMGDFGTILVTIKLSN